MIGINHRLPLTVPLLAGETATSFVERLAQRNGASVTRYFCTDLGVDWIRLMAGEATAVAQLAHLGGVSPATLQRNTPQIEQEKFYRLGAELLKSSSMVRKRLRFCPACIQEDMTRETGIYQRFVWQIEAVRTCSTHHGLLVEAPCETKYGSVWDFGKQVRGLPELLRDPVAKVDAATPLKLQSYILARIEGVGKAGWLDRLDLHVVAQTSAQLGLLLTLGALADPKTVPAHAWVKADEAGFNALAQGEAAFWQGLRGLLKPVPFEQQKPRTVFGSFHKWLTYRRDDRSFDPIRQSYVAFVYAHFALPDGVTIFGVEHTHKTLFNIPCAAKLTGVSNREMATKALQAGLATHNPETNHIKLLEPISLAQAKRFAKELRALIDTQDAAHSLGLNKRVFEQLVRKKFITSSRKTPQGAWKFTQGDLDKFVQLALSKARPNPCNDCEPIAEVAKILSCKSEQIFQLLLTGNLKTVVLLDENNTLQSLGVSINELRSLATIPPDLGYSRADAAAKLRMKTETVKRLIDIGLLREKLIRFCDHGRTAHVVTARSVEVFEAKYISLGRLAYIKNRTPGPLAMQLRAARILPHKEVHGVGNIYRRSEVLEVP